MLEMAGNRPRWRLLRALTAWKGRGVAFSGAKSSMGPSWSSKLCSWICYRLLETKGMGPGTPIATGHVFD